MKFLIFKKVVKTPNIPLSHYTDITLYTKQEMDDFVGILLSSDTDFFPLDKPAILPATQATANIPTILVDSLYTNLGNNYDAPPLNIHQPLTNQIPVSSVNVILRSLTPVFIRPQDYIPHK